MSALSKLLRLRNRRDALPPADVMITPVLVDLEQPPLAK
jgi:hypothetical protein